MQSIQSYPCAKLNLSLRILGNRPSDGYHLLDMLVVRTTFCDELLVSLGDTSVSRTGHIDMSVHSAQKPLDIPPEKNLCYRAAQLFLRNFDLLDRSVSLSLTKHIPAGAGLGGGSSDAAETLLALRKLFEPERQIPDSALHDIALELGTDIPFFLQPSCAHVSGVGDVVRPLKLPILEDVPCALFFPGEHIPTVSVYSQYRERGEAQEREQGSVSQSPSVEKMSYEDIVKGISNDLEDTVCSLFPKTASVLQVLRKLSPHKASITGSGSTVFVLPHSLFTKRCDFERDIRDIAARNDFDYLLTSLTCKCSAVSPL